MKRFIDVGYDKENKILEQTRNMIWGHYGIDELIFNPRRKKIMMKKFHSYSYGKSLPRPAVDVNNLVII